MIDLIKILSDKGLKITPQRIAVLEALFELQNHPSAENIIELIRKKNPNISTGTVYNTLETFIENKIINKVKTDKDMMRYDSILEKHHHLYSTETEQIEDYYDKELNDLIDNYFKKKNIPNFKIEDIKLQIIGTFINKKD